MRRRLVRLSLVILIAAVASGCGESTPATNPTPATRPKPVNAVAAQLMARPLGLPKLEAGSSCPITPISTSPTGIGSPRGKGPFYLGGGMPTGAFPFNKMVYEVKGTPNPLLLRGGRIDGPGRLLFSGNPADLAEKADVRSSDGGVTAAFYQTIFDSGFENALFVFPSARGCYAIQVDGASFMDVIVLEAR
jgi:hypothetical protein